MDPRSDSIVSAPLARFAAALIDAGFDAVLVGGAVRDELLGLPATDLDLVTQATTEQVRDLANACEEVRSVYAVGERFGTVGVVLVDGTSVEVSRYREPALAGTAAGARFAADASWRDFTVNAIARDLATGQLLDPVGGVADLASGVLRSPGDPAVTFADDPLRVLRLARFVSQLGFSAEGATMDAARAVAPRLEGVAVERVRDELTKLLVADHPDQGLCVALETGALDVVLPEVAAMAGVEQPSFHDLDVFEHTLQSVTLAPATKVLRWSALLHDVGKPPTRSIEPDGRIRFFRHASEGARIAEQICRRLRFSNVDTAAIVHLVREHMRLGDVHYDNRRAIERAVRKLDLWERGSTAQKPLVSAEDALELTMADFGATAHRAEAPKVREVLEEAVAQVRGDAPPAPARSPLSGADIMQALTIKQGYRVGVVKKAVEAAIESGDLAADDREGALVLARRTLETLQGE